MSEIADQIETISGQVGLVFLFISVICNKG